MMAVALLSGCAPDTECRIHGEMGNHERDGKKIFLLPLIKSDSIDVDSTVIEDGKFEFVSHQNMMGIIRMDYHFRYGTEELLVVVEPGDVNVRIDTISWGGGTPMNDSLQQWKEYTMAHLKRIMPYRQQKRLAGKQGDTLTAKSAKARMDSLQREYRHYSRELAERLDEGVLKDFLKEKFPTSYKKKHPDGTIEEIMID